MENKLKHLEFIQNIITRMGSNSFLIKGWVVTLLSAIFVLAASGSNPSFVFITYFAIPFFWALDGYFLSKERQYRCLYNEVRITSEEKIDFSLDASKYINNKTSWVNSTLSISLIIFYLSTVGATFIVIFLITK